MKQAFSSIVGNLALRQRFLEDVTRKKTAHAYIIEGAKGTGKNTVARALAASLACQNKDDPSLPLPCGECPACKKVLGGNSPDLIYVEREEDRSTIGIAAVRALRSDVCVAPNDLDYKIYVIPEAHLLTQEAQNAFLLTLEEPPAYVLFLLLCETTEPLLETVKSRAPTLRTELLSPTVIDAYLSENAEAMALKQTAPRDYEELLVASEGSIGRALSLLSASARKPIMTRRENAREFVRLAFTSRKSTDAVRLINTLGIKRDELVQQISVLQLCLRDLLACKQTEEAPLCFYADREEACRTAYRFTTPQLLRLLELTTDTCEKLQANTNVRLTLLSLASQAGLL